MLHLILHVKLHSTYSLGKYNFDNLKYVLFTYTAVLNIRNVKHIFTCSSVSFSGAADMYTSVYPQFRQLVNSLYMAGYLISVVALCLSLTIFFSFR
jgi:hypothetical protein